MKRFSLCCIIAALACCTMQAQSSKLPNKGLGVQIGFAEPIVRLNTANTAYSKDSLASKTVLNGLKVGVVYDETIIKGFGASIGLNYTFAAGSTDWTTPNALQSLTKTKTQTLYQQMEVFVDWQYKFEIAQETYLILTTGPTIQCGLEMSKRIYMRNELVSDVTLTEKLSCYDYEDSHKQYDYLRINATWGIGAGFQYQRYFLRGGYDFGLVNPYKLSNFNEMGYTLDRRTRGRLDQWNIRLGIYLWESK